MVTPSESTLVPVGCNPWSRIPWIAGSAELMSPVTCTAGVPMWSAGIVYSLDPRETRLSDMPFMLSIVGSGFWQAGTRSCSLDCSSQGICLAGKCLCRQGYYGQSCSPTGDEEESSAPNFLWTFSAGEHKRCLNDCSGNGQCHVGPATRIRCNDQRLLHSSERCRSMSVLGEVRWRGIWRTILR